MKPKVTRREDTMKVDIVMRDIQEEYMMDLEDMRRGAQNNVWTGGRHHMKLVSTTLQTLTMLTEMPIDGRKPLQPRTKDCFILI